MGDKKKTKKLRVNNQTLSKVGGGANIGDSQNCHNVYESNNCKIESENECLIIKTGSNAHWPDGQKS